MAVETTRPVANLPRHERLEVILERDGPSCIWCGRPIATRLVAATTEHVVPRVKGGPSWIENEVAACRRCNSQRGHLTPAEWIDE
ncbi:MAG: HNH endonuclease, partial [Actinomycetota bacterium]|nr:HNH endonuclease [Actinomycetota bacterium]